MASKGSKSRKGSKGSAPHAAQPQQAGGSSALRWALVGTLVLVAMFGVYRVVTAGGNRGASTSSASSSASSPAAAGATKVTGPVTEGTAIVAGGVQRISVDVTTVYKPNVLRLRAGVPAQITFSGGQGCTGVVQSQELGFREDLTSGPKTVDLKALAPGTYSFSCGMNMVFGQIVVN